MSNFPKMVLAGTASLLIAAAAPAQAPAPDTASAQPPAPQARKSMLQKVDENGDGKVTRQEYEAALLKAFTALDKNGDGKISAEEFEGVLFADLDVNKDGVLTMEEYLTFYVGREATARAESAPAADTLYPKGAGEITDVRIIGYRKTVFKATDADADGKVTPGELKTYNSREFDFLDKNKDGFVTVEEVTAMAEMPVSALMAAENKPAAPAE